MLAWEALRMVWRASPKELLVATALQVVSAVLVAAQLLVARQIMQQLVAISHQGPTRVLYASFAMIAGVTAALGVVSALITHQQRLLVELVGRYAFDRIMAVASAVDFQSFETSEFYDQLQRARTSGEYRAIDMVTSLTTLLTAVITTAGIAIVLASLQPLLLVLALLAAVPGLIAAIYNSRQSYAFEHSMTAEGRERAYVVSLLSSRDAAKEVRLFSLGSSLRRRYATLTDSRIRELRAFLRQRLVVNVVGVLAGAAGTALALSAVALLLTHHKIGVATALTAGIAMQQIAGRLNAMTTNVARLVESGLFIDDLTAFLLLPPSTQALEDLERVEEPRTARTRLSNHLRIEDLTFAYPGTTSPVLHDVSLDVGPGEVVALVGENGSGKTTLVKLICGLYRPDRGRILWGGQDAASLRPETIRDEISVVFQDFIQYHFTAHDNIAFGRIERAATREDIHAAARQAGADSFLEQLPAGFSTRLGRQFDGGSELSVGQWQRLALARAFFRGGSFLVLDEPTAALDPRAETELFAAMRRLAAGRSVLLISHRFSSVRSADRIYVLDGGRVAESGSHDELMALGGRYAELFTLQAAAYLASRSS
jgi:ATP-binding cassette, subfamily B, bacterial